MSIYTYVTIRRGATQASPNSGSVIASNVQVQIDEMSAMIAQETGNGGHMYDMFNGYIFYMPPGTQMLRGDAWLDQYNSDSITGNPLFYQSVGRPERFPDGHVECELRLYEGNA